ncbi:MAG: hypothetical protein ACOYJZ_09535 [Acutalibacter sp.]
MRKKRQKKAAAALLTRKALRGYPSAPLLFCQHFIPVIQDLSIAFSPAPAFLQGEQFAPRSLLYFLWIFTEEAEFVKEGLFENAKTD